MVASIAGDEVRDNRTKTFAQEATRQLQQPGYSFPCRVDSSSGQLGVFATRRILAGEVERATRQQHRHVACPCARQEITHDARRGRAALAAARDATRDAALAALANPSTER